ncbi:hypothetical protein UR09_04775 [Candidatus Nitromaritima sp. SCGC AAA799-A02]|nr:hypothetical protein UR09_04775 [Candidatus Nitromaritima sp. SCGC AAA799-A02]
MPGSWEPMNEKILIVDDDPNILEDYRRRLRKQFHIETALGAEMGLKAIVGQTPYAIVISDMAMPGMDGWEVLTQLKADPQLAKIPVIILSMVDDKNQGYSLGTAEYLLKPVDRNQIGAILKKYRNESSQNHILIIEDDPKQRELLRAVLEPKDFTVDEAEDGKTGLQKVTENQPDAIILDLMMPEMDGFEFLDKFRANPEWESIPVIVVSAKDLTAEEYLRLNGSVQKIFQKGIYSQEELVGKVNVLIKEMMGMAN